MYLSINGTRFDLDCNHVIDSCPPLECYDVVTTAGVPFEPRSDSKTKQRAGDEALTCQVVDCRGDVAFNFGGRIEAHITQSDHFVVASEDTSGDHVLFRFDLQLRQLLPLSCSFHRTRKRLAPR